jgi:GDPmannose 4,6-dehydratase
MKKRTLIFGASGQDGSYLCEHLLDLGYDIFATVRRHSIAENQQSRLDHIMDKITTDYCDISDPQCVDRIVQKAKADEIYNLAAQSHVRISADIPYFTIQANAVGSFNILEAIRRFSPSSRFYQASSSEMFGNNIDEDKFQREDTPMHPVSVYGITKLFSYSMTRYYRRAHKIFACNGILFNHDSKRRGSNFVTAKVAKTAVQIKLGLANKIVLGNLESYRDFGHSSDYVKAMHLIINHTEPDDFVVSTMETHCVKDMCDYVFNKLGINYKDYLEQDPKLLRPEELNYLRGDSTKARTILGWKPDFTFEMIMDEMVDYWMEYYQNQRSVGLDYSDLYPNLKGIN